MDSHLDSGFFPDNSVTMILKYGMAVTIFILNLFDQKQIWSFVNLIVVHM